MGQSDKRAQADASALSRRQLLVQRAARSGAERRLQRQLAHYACAAKEGSKAGGAALFAHKPGHADNAENRAIVHHWGGGGGGSHYWCAAAKTAQKGKEKGLSSRHSKQGQRLQASRNEQRAKRVDRGQMGVRNSAQKASGSSKKPKGKASKGGE